MSEERILQKLTRHDARLEKIEHRLVAVTEHMVTKADAKHFATKDDLVEFRDEVLTGLDRQMVILQRLDQERIFTAEWIKRLEREVAEHDQEIKRIKQLLKVT